MEGKADFAIRESFANQSPLIRYDHLAAQHAHLALEGDLAALLRPYDIRGGLQTAPTKSKSKAGGETPPLPVYIGDS
jgi:hypothetical protein